jgi:hypothetical protein
MTKKDVLYLDTEDDITAAINKVKASDAGIVAIVPPKRANMLSSVVNLKLLKRAAVMDKKKVVLITEDETLASMAGGIGMFVARDLKTAPSIPRVENVELPSNVIKADPAFVPKPTPQAERPVSSVDAGKMAVADSIEKPKTATDKPVDGKKAKKGKGGASKIPDISKFRKKIFIAVGVFLLLIVGGWWAFFIAPSADVTLMATTTEIPFEQNVSLSTQDGIKLDAEGNLIPAQVQETSEEIKQEYNASGEKNVGKTASGTMNISNCQTPSSFTVKKGTKFTADGRSFTSTQSVAVPGAQGNFISGCSQAGEASVPVTATDKGEDYNLAPTQYSHSIGGQVTANGGQMSGGTDEVIKVVEQSDIDSASAKIAGKGDVEALNDLKAKFKGDGLIVIDSSFKTEPGKPTASAPAGTETDKGTVTMTVKHRLLAISTDDYKEFLNVAAEEDIDDGQKLVDHGEKDAEFTPGDGNVFTLKAELKAGPDIDFDALKKELKKNKFSEAIKKAESKPGVKKAEIDLKPFWVFSMPRTAEKIDINIESP